MKLLSRRRAKIVPGRRLKNQHPLLRMTRSSLRVPLVVEETHMMVPVEVEEAVVDSNRAEVVGVVGVVLLPMVFRAATRLKLQPMLLPLGARSPLLPRHQTPGTLGEPIQRLMMMRRTNLGGVVLPMSSRNL
jgi:hypothetical protein